MTYQYLKINEIREWLRIHPIIKEGIPFRREGGAICLIDVFVVVFPEIKCFVFARKKLLDS